MKFKIPHKFKISNLLYNKKFTIILSVVLAFALWLGIAMVENPIRQQTFNDLSANITLEGTAADGLGLGIVSDVTSQKFSITVSGPNYVVSSLKAEDFSLSASTVEINSAGKFSLNISAVNNSSKTGFTITSINPSKIDVLVDYIDTRTFDVLPKLIGVSASEGLVAETPVLTDSKQSILSIKGPVTTLDKIATVAAYKEVNDTLSTSQTFGADIVLYDSGDNIIYRYSADGSIYDANDNIITNSYLSLSFEDGTFNNVNVTQPISKQKTVTCKPVFNNLPAGLTQEDIKYTINHSSITIIGTPEIIDNIENISLSAIDFRQVTTSTNTFEVSATLPNGVKILDNIENLVVEINTSKYAEKTLNINDIRWSSLQEGLKASTASQLKNVKLCGPENIIKKIKSSDLYALVNLENKTAGVYTVEVVIKSDVYDEVWQIGTYNISITLE